LLDPTIKYGWEIKPYPEILLERGVSPGFETVLEFLDTYERTMVAEELLPFGIQLIPTGEDSNALNRIIQDLAEKFNTSPFPAHVTLCSGYAPAAAFSPEIAARVDRVCRELGPISAMLSDIDQTDDYGTFFFAKVRVVDGEGTTLQSRIAAVVEAPERPTVGLHLSMMYSEPSAEIDRAELALRVKPKLPTRVLFDRLRIVMPERGDWRDVESWKIIHEAKL
jgi:hypothetical protein